MNPRRLGVLAARTAVFVVLALIVAVLNGWSVFAITAVALTGGALAVQLGGILWLRRAERSTADTSS